jgi:hypothetical protein
MRSLAFFQCETVRRGQHTGTFGDAESRRLGDDVMKDGSYKSRDHAHPRKEQTNISTLDQARTYLGRWRVVWETRAKGQGSRLPHKGVPRMPASPKQSINQSTKTTSASARSLPNPIRKDWRATHRETRDCLSPSARGHRQPSDMTKPGPSQEPSPLKRKIATTHMRSRKRTRKYLYLFFLLTS